MRENQYQTKLIQTLYRRFPGAFILKNDSGYVQGIPDILILYNDRWAMLEVKRSANSPVSPNQKHYVGYFNDMSFAAFIYPENEDLILDDLQYAFSARRTSRLSERQ
mgnify:CR=1 FL=1